MSDISQRSGVDTKVGALGLSSRNVNVTGKIVSISEPREVMWRTDNMPHRVADALIGDETAVVILTLWDEKIDQAKVGEVITVKNGYVRTYRGTIRLNIGRYGTMEKSTTEIPVINTDNNISEKVYEDTRRQRFGYGRRRYSRY